MDSKIGKRVMPLAILYQNTERSRAEQVGQCLEDRGYDVRYAPIGLQLGTPEWKDQVERDTLTADASLLLLTQLSVIDDWVRWRTEIALKNCIMLFPLKLDKELPDTSTWHLPREVLRYNWLDFSEPVYLEEAINRLATYLRKASRTTSCFISYSRDDQDNAIRLRSDLRNANIKGWRDIDDIQPGASWDNQIASAIASCSVILFIVTPTSVTSQNVADELSYAREKKKPIIPLIFRKAPLPLRVHRAQAIDFTQDYDTALKVLIEDLLGRK